jgi:hypothetical protein
MRQKFAQISNIPVAIGFAGLVLISQLMVYNMGYQMPWYFLLILGVLSLMIVWGLIANDIMLESERLVVMSGPFKNTIPLSSITALEPGKKGFLKNRKANHKLVIHYHKSKKIDLYPKDRAALVQAMTKQIPKLQVSDELKGQ